MNSLMSKNNLGLFSIILKFPANAQLLVNFPLNQDIDLNIKTAMIGDLPYVKEIFYDI